jgi:hypothetical protein
VAIQFLAGPRSTSTRSRACRSASLSSVSDGSATIACVRSAQRSTLPWTAMASAQGRSGSRFARRVRTKSDHASHHPTPTRWPCQSAISRRRAKRRLYELARGDRDVLGDRGAQAQSKVVARRLWAWLQLRLIAGCGAGPHGLVSRSCSKLRVWPSRRPTSGSSHHHTSPRAGSGLTLKMLRPPRETTPSHPRRQPPQVGARLDLSASTNTPSVRLMPRAMLRASHSMLASRQFRQVWG